MDLYDDPELQQVLLEGHTLELLRDQVQVAMRRGWKVDGDATQGGASWFQRMHRYIMVVPDPPQFPERDIGPDRVEADEEDIG